MIGDLINDVIAGVYPEATPIVVTTECDGPTMSRFCNERSMASVRPATRRMALSMTSPFGGTTPSSALRDDLGVADSVLSKHLKVLRDGG
ncbi:MAG: hypothetical protein R2735_07465 [Microthrixaceae bacterium]